MTHPTPEAVEAERETCAALIEKYERLGTSDHGVRVITISVRGATFSQMIRARASKGTET